MTMKPFSGEVNLNRERGFLETRSAHFFASPISRERIGVLSG